MTNKPDNEGDDYIIIAGKLRWFDVVSSTQETNEEQSESSHKSETE